MKERPLSGTVLSERFRLVLLHLAEEARRDLDAISVRPARAIHSVRTRMKNVRALLLLLKSRLTKKSRTAVHALAGSLKDAFGEIRDAQILAELRAKFSGRDEPAAKRPLAPLHAEKIKRAKADASRLVRLVARMSFTGLSWSDVFARFVHAYRAGRKQMKICRRKPTPDAFHKWRRRVKDLFYQSQVLQPLDAMVARRRHADRLASRLGLLHDLRPLHAEAKKSHDAPLLKHIEKKRRGLPDTIFKAAEKLFAERPRQIAALLERCVKFQPGIAAQAVRQT